MSRNRFHSIHAFSLLVVLLVLFRPAPASAHCDTLDGPVILAARRALETGNVNHVLIWVQPGAEPELRAAFEAAMKAGSNGVPIPEPARRRFFETLVRVHREGEGAPYTGIKPAGTPLDPGVRAADEALAAGTPEPARRILSQAVGDRLQQEFQSVLKWRSHDPDDVAAGRRYVQAYVSYTHFVEGIHRTATAAVTHHGPGNAGHGGHDGPDHAGHGGHDGHRGHLPWILSALLGLGLLVETVVLVSSRRASGPKTQSP